MKRDMDLVRSLLLEIEEKHVGSGRQVDLVGDEGRSRDEVVEHLFMLAEAGFIEARDASHMQARDIVVLRMTWQGHEFLESVRDPRIWARTKEGANRIGSLSLEVLVDLAKGIARAKAAEFLAGGGP